MASASSLGDVLFRNSRTFAERPALFLAPPKGSDVFTPITYTELWERVRGFAGALRDYGVERGDRVSIFAENSPEWAIFDWACQTLGIVVVPIYPTLPPDQAQHILRDCGAKLVIVGTAELGKKVGDVPFLLVRGEGSLAEKAAQSTIDDAAWAAIRDSVLPDDTATIIYTSGTTGLPKGVMLSHRACMHAIEFGPRTISIDKDDLFFSFLPLCHVYERIAGHFLPIGIGASIAYARNLASIASDLAKVNPTVMFCVPRFLEAFFDRVTEHVKKQSPLRQKLFKLAIAQGVKKARGQFAPLQPLLDTLVMKKVRERVGMRMRYFVSGGAALAPHVAEFYLATGLVVLQGYGLTETAGPCSINHPDRNKYWTVGEPLGMEITLAADGEILVRGNGVMTGYYNMPEETARAIDTEGWFHTGDIGAWEGPSLKITDRKKDLLVLGNGKNIAPQLLENRLRESELIQEVVVLGDGQEYCAALIVPAFDKVRKALGLADAEPLADRDDVRKLIKAEVDAVNKTLASFEMVKKFALLETPFSIESGELTPTLKVKRKVVLERNAEKAATLFR